MRRFSSPISNGKPARERNALAVKPWARHRSSECRFKQRDKSNLAMPTGSISFWQAPESSSWKIGEIYCEFRTRAGRASERAFSSSTHPVSQQHTFVLQEARIMNPEGLVSLWECIRRWGDRTDLLISSENTTRRYWITLEMIEGRLQDASIKQSELLSTDPPRRWSTDLNWYVRDAFCCCRSVAAEFDNQSSFDRHSTIEHDWDISMEWNPG